ncbi:MAG: hypothetical protein R3D33_13545 [Hyphomicrobiaceae bacterium]
MLAYYEGNSLTYAGRVGTGFKVDEARAMADGLAAICSPPPMFARPMKPSECAELSGFHPPSEAQIAWRDVTSDGLLRHATFEHFRTDIAVRDVLRPEAMCRVENL